MASIPRAFSFVNFESFGEVFPIHVT